MEHYDAEMYEWDDGRENNPSVTRFKSKSFASVKRWANSQQHVSTKRHSQVIVTKRCGDGDNEVVFKSRQTRCLNAQTGEEV
jgi:hypothetical protein